MSSDIHAHKILIVDFGSQYTQLIARRVREIGVYCEIFPFDVEWSCVEAFSPKGIILSGGPESVGGDDAPQVDPRVFSLGIPLFGICYGMQTMAHQLGGVVAPSSKREYGYTQLALHGHCHLFEHIEDQRLDDGIALLDVWMSHGDKVTELPAGFKVVASTPNSPFAGIADDSRHFYGVQFHPEVTHTTQGERILSRFVVDICQCDTLWTPKHIVDELIVSASQQVGDDAVILGLSGGVDSSVVAMLLHQAIGKQLTCVFVDNGLLRLDEGVQLMKLFDEHFGIHVVHVRAEDQFLDALAGVSDPEEKRKIIGRVFVDVFDAEAKKLDGVKWLAQGTIYPDVIESAGSKSGKAHVIKSHHNVGGLPEKMSLKLLEPLRELFKDEVRRLGEELGLTHAFLHRHPFPGPGLGVRILGEIHKSFADTLRLADAIFIEELVKHDLYHKVSQAFAVFLPVKSVGVVGDARQYEYVVALRAVETIDFMTARWADLPYEFLSYVSLRIINEVSGVSRVVYDISGKPPATIEWE